MRSRVGKLDERWLAHAAADLQWQERFLRVERDSERLTSECRSATAAVEQRLRGLEESSVRRDVEITHVAKRVGDIGQKLRALVERVESQVPGYRLRRDETRR